MVEGGCVDRVLGLLRRHGVQATSFQVLEPGYRYWFSRDGGACIAYAEVGGARVTVGEPIGDPACLEAVVAAFVAESACSGRRVRFFHVGQEFVDRTGLSATLVGELAEWDPADWCRVVQADRGLRQQLRRARNKGVTIRTLEGGAIRDSNGAERMRLHGLVRRWLATRGMPALAFMAFVDPFSFPEERRYAVAERDGDPVGLAVAVPVYARQGWFIEDLVRDPAAPNGTSELLLDALMRSFSDHGVRYATLGLAPLSGEVSAALARVRVCASRLYNFDGLRTFRQKLRPRCWMPVYMAFPAGERGLVALYDLLQAFAPEGLLKFGLQTLEVQWRGIHVGEALVTRAAVSRGGSDSVPT